MVIVHSRTQRLKRALLRGGITKKKIWKGKVYIASQAKSAHSGYRKQAFRNMSPT